MPTLPPGRFITFEGPEGGGKSTQTRLLGARLARAGITILHTREPGGTPIGQELRAMLLAPERPTPTPVAQALLLSADRAQHVAEVIRPALAQGTTVICDRFSDATLAYQGFGDGLDVEVLRVVTRFATGGLTADLTVLLDVDVAVGLERKRAAHRAGHGELNRIDRRDLAFHRRVREGYLTLARAEPTRFLLVDGALPVDEIAERIWGRVAELLGPVARILRPTPRRR